MKYWKMYHGELTKMIPILLTLFNFDHHNIFFHMQTEITMVNAKSIY